MTAARRSRRCQRCSSMSLTTSRRPCAAGAPSWRACAAPACCPPGAHGALPAGRTLHAYEHEPVLSLWCGVCLGGALHVHHMVLKIPTKTGIRLESSTSVGGPAACSLDQQLLRGGLREGHHTEVAGEPGSGKSQLCMQVWIGQLRQAWGAPQPPNPLDTPDVAC